jgi:hypothetical protein
MSFIWPSRFPLRTIGAVILSLAIAIGSIKLWQLTAPPSEAFYLGSYVKSSLFVALPGLPNKRETFRTFTVMDGSHPRRVKMSPTAFRSWLQDYVYGGKDLTHTVEVPLIASGLVFLILYFLASRADKRTRDRLVNEGIQTSGRRIIGFARFNRKASKDKRPFAIDIEELEVSKHA